MMACMKMALHMRLGSQKGYMEPPETEGGTAGLSLEGAIAEAQFCRHLFQPVGSRTGGEEMSFV